jgi:hypothetical protein
MASGSAKAAARAATRNLIIGGGECKLGCTRPLATGSITGICTTCLSNLSQWRAKGHDERIRYDKTLDLRKRRLNEVEHHPKGYKGADISTRNSERRVASSKVVRDSARKSAKRPPRTLSTTQKKRVNRTVAKATAERSAS